MSDDVQYSKFIEQSTGLYTQDEKEKLFDSAKKLEINERIREERVSSNSNIAHFT